MTNLLMETERVLKNHNKTFDDIEWISVEGELIPIDLFRIQADKSYDSGYGSAEVNESLLIVGDGWWLERREYDGSEWWEFVTAPVKPNRPERCDLNIFNEGY